jgi:membrane associated rhomboid family serine protease
MGYNPPKTSYDSFLTFLHRGGAPATNALLVINVFTFVTAFLLPQYCGPFYGKHFVFSFEHFDTVLRRPWTLVTYALFPGDPQALVVGGGWFWILFGGYSLWQFGGSLERSWGTRTYALLLTALTAIFALSLAGGYALLARAGLLVVNGFTPTALVSYMMPLAGVIVAFCTLNPGEVISFWFFPTPAKWITIITFGFCWVYFGLTLGLFADVGCLAALLYVRNGRGYTRYTSYATRSVRGPDLRVVDFDKPRRPNVYIDGSPPPPKPFNLARMWRERQERKRLEKLWNESRIPPKQDWPDEDRR